MCTALKKSSSDIRLSWFSDIVKSGYCILSNVSYDATSA